jgi:hypothetical protein
MIQASFLHRCILAAAIIPMVAGAAVVLTPQRAIADEGCFCQPSLCNDFDATCYVLVCSDGTSKNCDGKWKET